MQKDLEEGKWNNMARASGVRKILQCYVRKNRRRQMLTSVPS